MQNLLEVRDLAVHFPVTGGFPVSRVLRVLRAVDGVSFGIAKGETMGLVGESGCGKSTTARAILQIIRPTAGRVFFRDADLAALSGSALRGIYRHMQVIYQDPYASLNPRMTVGGIIQEPLRVFRLASGKELRRRVQDLMGLVGLEPRYINRFPHEFSGGQRQRIGVARALAVDPALILCDEPVSALDVSIQAQIINLMEDLQEKFGFSYLFIAHDLSVVRHISDRVAVMYHGRIVERAPVEALFENPSHPYTRALLSAVPVPDPAVEAERRRTVLTGEVPGPDAEIPGCHFYSRCPERMPRCETIDPPWFEVADGHAAACLLLE